jgi:hypothetical protein
MHRLLFVGLAFLVGCQGLVGPVKRTCITDPIDNPCLTLEEQKERERDRLALPYTSPATGPRTYAENPAYRGP